MRHAVAARQTDTHTARQRDADRHDTFSARLLNDGEGNNLRL